MMLNRFTQLFRGKSAMTGLPHLHDSARNFTPPSVKIPARELQLDIIIGGRCPVCQSSLGMLEQLRQELPNVNVRIIDFDAPNTVKPNNVIAIPTFLINGHVVATGNPALNELKQFIHSLS